MPSDNIKVAGVEITREEFGLGGDLVEDYHERDKWISYAGTQFARPVFFSLLVAHQEHAYVCSACGKNPCDCPDCQQGVYVCTFCYRPTARCNCPGPRRDKGIDNQPVM
jgi:hypothetical protein